MSVIQGGVTGFLLSCPTTVERTDLKVYALTFADSIGPTKWERCGFKTEKALFDEDQLGMRPPFQYPVVCRRSGRRLVLLASNNRIIDQLLSEVGNISNDSRLTKIPIAVDALVKSISQNAGRYTLSFIHARMSSSSSALRSVSFYGDDVTQSRLFKDHSDDLNCYGCGLRHEVYGFEAIRLGSDGAISCASSGQTRLRQLEAALTFVSGQGFFREPKS